MKGKLTKGSILFLLIITLHGCALLYKLPSQPPLPPEQVAAIVSEIQEQDAKVDSFFRSGRLAVKEGYWEQESHILAAALKEPLKIKIEITNPWGQPVIHLLVDGKVFSALSFPDRKAYVGEFTQDSISKLFPEPLDPEMMWDVLRGYPSLRACHHPGSQRANQISLFDGGGSEIQILDLEPDSPHPRLVSFPGLATQLAFSGFQVSEGIIYAQQVKVTYGKGSLTLTNEKAVFNGTIPSPIFTLEQPSGFETVDLDALEKGKRLF